MDRGGGGGIYSRVSFFDYFSFVVLGVGACCLFSRGCTEFFFTQALRKHWSCGLISSFCRENLLVPLGFLSWA